MSPTAVIMNMFYTGLGIARSLGERDIPVIGLTAQRGIYGNFTRYARTAFCPDSRNDPDGLLAYLLRMGEKAGNPSVIFPSRDDDALFLDRFRKELAMYFIPVVPESSVLKACLNKWETYLWAQRTGVSTPKCWLIDGERDLYGIASELTYPCVLKPVASYQWRKAGNWDVAGGRKAIRITSWKELLAEYTAIRRADKRVLLQEMVPGGDDCLVITACYLDRESNLVAAFNAQKLAQAPEGFGTGFIVQSVDRPGLLEPTVRLLQGMRFSGIAEVEYKWDASSREYKLIEINPRPWDQHRLGTACGVDLIYLAYCEHARLPMPTVGRQLAGRKWIAEDAFFTAALRLLWRRNPKLLSLLQLVRGRRVYAIWSPDDPLPLLAYMILRFIPGLVAAGVRSVWSAFKGRMPGMGLRREKGLTYESHWEKGKGHC